MPRYSSEENRHRRMDTDTAVAAQLEDERRRAALAADRRDRLAFLVDERTDLDGWFDRIAEGRSAT